MYGTIYLPSIPEGMSVSGVGGRAFPADGFPGVVPGRLRLSGFSRDGVLAAGSNGFKLVYHGAGTLVFERFDQMITTSLTDGISRSILSMEAGWIQFDGRDLANGSQMVLELPFGRLLLEYALGSVNIEHDQRSRIYSFEILCAEGLIQLIDNAGVSFDITSGQCITGAGTSFKPLFEVSDLTQRSQEVLAAFTRRCSKELVALEKYSKDLLEAMEPVFFSGQASFAKEPVTLRPAESEKRPYVIEFSPNPPPVLPRYGTVRSLSDEEARLY